MPGETTATSPPGGGANLAEVPHTWGDPAGLRLPDRGPRYVETPANPYAPDAPPIAEPYNTATAAIFIAIAGYWAWRLRGRYRAFGFLTACLPLLLAGGVGGTLYHATRTRTAYFLLDVVPISLIGVGVALFLTWRLAQNAPRGRALRYALGLVAAYLFVNGVLFRSLPEVPGYPNLRINLSYASLAALILAPITVALVRTQFRHWQWVVASLMLFALGFFCRLVDAPGMTTLPMGTHWLWHLFGAATTHAMSEYLYRLEGESNLPPPPPAPPAAAEGAGRTSP